MKTWQQYTSRSMHDFLLAKCGSSADAPWTAAQALMCPYYVPLRGRLGADWGAIVNPLSSRFGLLTFEHADCGCPKGFEETDDGYGRHPGAPQQDGDMWGADWKHECHEWLCDNPCDAPEEWT